MRKLDVLRIMCLTLLLASTMRGQTAPGVNNAALHPLQTSLPLSLSRSSVTGGFFHRQGERRYLPGF